ncbi:MAG: cupin domain-containing protein [Chloroflexota bacterium]
MRHISESQQPLEEWRDGVSTRLIAAGALGSSSLTIFEQWCDPGHGAPLHQHAVEEVLRVLSGKAEFEVDGERRNVGSGECVIVPAGANHGFVNAGDEVLHTEAILAAPIFEAHYLEGDVHQRRWTPVEPL